MINIDADINNADWSKQTWDLLNISNKQELLEYLEKTNKSLEDFKKLPAYKFNVDKIDWLREI
mgnify:FL=1